MPMPDLLPDTHGVGIWFGVSHDPRFIKSLHLRLYLSDKTIIICSPCIRDELAATPPEALTGG
jgi:hypothetical protein